MSTYAFLFPGQGSQFPGMGKELCARHAIAERLFAEAEEILDMPLTRLCFEGPAEALQETRVTQPAIFTHSVAAWRVLAELGLEPAAVAGHSLGEYAALVAAGVLDFAPALRWVKRRAELMQDAGRDRPGAMTAVIGLEDSKVVELCKQAAEDGIVVPANFNAPGQVVVSGEIAAVERLGALAREAGARRVVPLPVSGAFHSPLMESAAGALGELLERTELRPARIPVLSNVTAEPTTEPEELRRNLVRQMSHPVRWVEIIERLGAMGVERAVEVGPGTVLKGLVRRIRKDMIVHPAGTPEEVTAAVEAVS